MTAPGSGPPAARLPVWLREAGPPLAVVLAVLALWEGAVAVFPIEDYLLPAPSQVWRALVEMAPVLPEHIAATLTEALAGLAVAVAVALPVAALVVASPAARRALLPLLVLSQNIPMIVLAPMLAVWFGFGLTPKVFVVALIGFFPIAVSTIDGLLGADRDAIDLVRGMGGGRLRVLRTVLVPSALPSFFAGLKISATYAILGAVIAEWVGASAGLGLFLTRAQTAFRTDRVLAGVVVIAVLSLAMFALVQVAARLAMPYRHLHAEEKSP